MAPPTRFPQLLDRAWLVDKYVDKRRTTYEIATEIGCSHGNVWIALRRHQIPTRSRQERVNNWQMKACVRCGEAYQPTGPAQRFCSSDCLTKPSRCVQCDQTFRPGRKRWSYYNHEFCSQDCRNAYRLDSGRGQKPRVQGTGGYMLVRVSPDRPGAYGTGYMPEHRVVMEMVLGRALLLGENVHHRNGVRADNRPENLELWVTSQPKGQRVEDVVAHAIEMLARYAPERLKT